MDVIHLYAMKVWLMWKVVKTYRNLVLVMFENQQNGQSRYIKKDSILESNIFIVWFKNVYLN